MAPRKKELNPSNIEVCPQMDNSEDFSVELIKQLNKEAGDKIAFNLSHDDAPTNVKRWIPSGSRLLDYIMSNKRGGGFPEGRIIEIQGPPSCHAAGDKVLMFDGSVKNVEDVCIGDRLMGPDSTPRTVLQLFNGEDDLYTVKTRWGYSQTFSSNHILALSKLGRMVKISVKDYLTTSKTNTHHLKWVQPINGFEFSEVGSEIQVIPPYILGLLIGDDSVGSNIPSGGRIELTTADSEIAEEYKAFCNSLGYSVSKHVKAGSVAMGFYYLNATNRGIKIDSESDSDKIRVELRKLGLLGTKSGDKFIPSIYKITSRSNRLELLAGLIDTDGYLNRTSETIEYVTKSNLLAQDVAFLARSLGFATTIGEKYVNGICYYRLHIAGKIETIPSRLERKKALGKIKARKHNTCNFTLTQVGNGKFYGFSVDQDSLYLSSNCGIIHNCGKSHLAFEAAKATQMMGGIAVYIDTENATSPDNLRNIGIDVKKNFVFIQTNCTEDVLKYAEMAILKSRSLNKDVPMTIIWDSVAACSPKAELNGEYEDNSIGLQARVLSKGMRKISNIIANQKVLFLLINQQRMRINVMYGDPTTTSGGMAIPYASSIRLRVMTGQPIKEGDRVIGINVEVKCIKNKVAKPFRSCELSIIFGKGVNDETQMFDVLRAHCDAHGAATSGDKSVLISGGGSWKNFVVSDNKTGAFIYDVKFYKNEFREKILEVPEFQPYLTDLLDAAMIMGNDDTNHITYRGADASSIQEMKRQDKEEDEDE